MRLLFLGFLQMPSGLVFFALGVASLCPLFKAGVTACSDPSAFTQRRANWVTVCLDQFSTLVPAFLNSLHIFIHQLQPQTIADRKSTQSFLHPCQKHYPNVQLENHKLLWIISKLSSTFLYNVLNSLTIPLTITNWEHLNTQYILLITTL